MTTLYKHLVTLLF